MSDQKKRKLNSQPFIDAAEEIKEKLDHMEEALNSGNVLDALAWARQVTGLDKQPETEQ